MTFYIFKISVLTKQQTIQKYLSMHISSVILQFNSIFMFQAHLGQALMTSSPKPHPLHSSSHIHEHKLYIFSYDGHKFYSQRNKVKEHLTIQFHLIFYLFLNGKIHSLIGQFQEKHLIDIVTPLKRQIFLLRKESKSGDGGGLKSGS